MKPSICFGPLCDSIDKASAAGGGGVMGLIGSVFSKAIMLFIVFSAFGMLLYLLMGGLEWITSGGEKEKIVKAQQKIQNAIIGLLIVVGALTLFGVVSGNILGIVTFTKDNGWIFKIPSLAN